MCVSKSILKITAALLSLAFVANQAIATECPDSFALPRAFGLMSESQANGGGAEEGESEFYRFESVSLAENISTLVATGNADISSRNWPKMFSVGGAEADQWENDNEGSIEYKE